MWAFVSVHTISALHFSFVLLYSFEWRTFYAFTGNIVRHLGFRLRLFVGLVMVRTRHLTCFWLFMVPNDALSAHLISNIVRHLIFRNDSTYRALHLSFLLIYCVSNDPLFMRLLSNIVRHEHFYHVFCDTQKEILI
jgi:hypothetical protein